MAKVTLTYDLNDKDDRADFKLACDAKRLWLMLWKLWEIFEPNSEEFKTLMATLEMNNINLEDYTV